MVFCLVDKANEFAIALARETGAKDDHPADEFARGRRLTQTPYNFYVAHLPPKPPGFTDWLS